MRRLASIAAFASLLVVQAVAAPTIGGCPVFPADSHWNTPVDTLPVHPFSNSWVTTIGNTTKLHPDWGRTEAEYGIPYITVGAGQPLVPICPDRDDDGCAFWDESDDGLDTTKSYPIPLDAPIEGTAASDGDRHVIAVDTSTCTLYELYRAFPQGGYWNAESYVKWNLNSNAQRPPGWTSADAAGLPIFPGLMRWAEAQGPGEIEHAIRFTAAQIWGREAGQGKWLWPATHWSGSSTISTRPPMGARFRLKASYQIPGHYHPVTQRILRAFKKYGLILADGGSNWFISGTTDASWPSDVDSQLKQVAGSNFEAVDTSLLMVNVNSGQAALPTPATTPRLANIATRGQVRTGDDVMIGGFIIGGAPKTVLIRARGPSLAQFGVPGTLANPTLELYSGQTLLDSNDNWEQSTNVSAIQASGLAPTAPNEAAILTTLGPGGYTAIVRGANGTTGVGIVEVFEVGTSGGAILLNIATRGRVETGDDVMIGGFIIEGNFPKTVVVRARGPSLAQFGVPGTLSNPFLQLYSGQTVIAQNDNWQTATFAAQMTANGVAPGDPNEAAIMITLAPGPYTAIVTGVGGSSGVGIVEVFAQ